VEVRARGSHAQERCDRVLALKAPRAVLVWLAGIPLFFGFAVYEEEVAVVPQLHEGRLSPRSVQKIMVMLYGVLKRAKRKKWITANPAEDAERVKLVPSGRFKALSVEEVHAVARAAEDEHGAALYITAAMTGLRVGELRALKWADLDFVNRTVHVRENFTDDRLKTPKSGRVRSVPMADQVAVVLDGLSQREHYTQPGDLVFANPYGRYMEEGVLRNGFYTALKRAGLGHKREGPEPSCSTTCATRSAPCARPVACRSATYRRTWATATSKRLRSTCTTRPNTTRQRS
jgi:integrase